MGRATVEVLERAGVTVEFPRGQTCCGQMHFNSGYTRDGERLARRLVGVFAGYEAVVTPSGACAAPVRAHGPELAERTFELSQSLAATGAEPRSSFAGTVAYHPTCHSLRMLRVGDAPLRLLDSVPGVELVALPDAEECCGFGGTFAV